jgi:hypothetical protein
VREAWAAVQGQDRHGAAADLLDPDVVDRRHEGGGGSRASHGQKPSPCEPAHTRVLALPADPLPVKAHGSLPGFTGYPASRHAFIPPSSATARVKPRVRNVAAANVEILPNSQYVTTRAVGSGSS